MVPRASRRVAALLAISLGALLAAGVLLAAMRVVRLETSGAFASAWPERLFPFVVLVAGWAAAFLLVLGRRLGRPTAEQILLREKARRPILFLRPFHTDDTRPARLDWVSRFTFLGDEQVLAGIFQELGPFVALGRPGRALAPLGAHRLSVTHEEWQDKVVQLIVRSRLVILQVSESVSFHWEVMRALESVPEDGLLFFFPLELDGVRLKRAYEQLRRDIEGLIPQPLPEIRSERFLLLRKNAAPLLFGAISTAGAHWLGLEKVGQFRRALRRFGEVGRLLLPGGRRFGRLSVSLGAVLGGPMTASLMILRNLWGLGRRRTVAFSVVVAAALSTAALRFASRLIPREPSPVYEPLLLPLGPSLGALLTEPRYSLSWHWSGGAIAVLLHLALGLVVFFSWRLYSPRELRLHLSFGGAMGPWTTLAGLVLATFFWLYLLLSFTLRG